MSEQRTVSVTFSENGVLRSSIPKITVVDTKDLLRLTIFFKLIFSGLSCWEESKAKAKQNHTARIPRGFRQKEETFETFKMNLFIRGDRKLYDMPINFSKYFPFIYRERANSLRSKILYLKRKL